MLTAIDLVGTNLNSGTKTYNYNFTKKIVKQELKNKIFIFVCRDFYKEFGDNLSSKIEFIVKPNFLKNSFFRFLWMQFILPFELKRLNIRQLFSPMNIGPLSLKYFNIRLILGLHSNLPWTYFKKMPGNFLRNYFTKYIMTYSINLCDELIVNSLYAKNEIYNILKINKEKIHVIHLGVERVSTDEQNKFFFNKELQQNDYILSVLSCVRYHNILNLLKAYKKLVEERNLELKFIIVTQILDKKYFYEIKNFIKKNFKKKQVILLHDINKENIENLYKYARLYVFSSYTEVFGFTSLEAMLCECPVLISDKSSLKEINGNAAEYFDPDNINQIASKMYQLLYDKDLILKLKKKGQEHCKKYTWKKTVDETLKVLKLIAK